MRSLIMWGLMLCEIVAEQGGPDRPRPNLMLF
jgi:hypothetical protein